MDDKNNRYENLVEKTFDEIGAFGKFQKSNMLLMICVATLPAITIYSTVFNLAQPSLICYDNVNNESIKQSDICNVWNNVTKSNEKNELTIYECQFDTKYYEKTIFTDWNLYCDRKYLAGLTQTFYLVGTVAAIFCGYFGDHYGRRKSIIGFLAALAVLLNLSQLLVSNYLGLNITVKYVIYCLSQFLTGIFCNCLYISSYVLMIESTTQSYHTLFSNIHLSVYVLGELIILVPSYFIRNWEINNWIVAGFTVICWFMVFFFLNESPRWLISNKRFKEAESIFKKIANINGKTWKKRYEITENNFNFQSYDDVLKNVEEKDIKNTKNTNLKIKTMMQLICFPKINFKKSTLFSCVWFSLNLLYYGVSLGVASIDSINPYLMFIFSCIAELLGYLICTINDRIGRKRAIMIYFILSGIICLVISFVPRNEELDNKDKVIIDAVIIIILVSIGKCMASAAFNTCYVFTSEYYQTNVRNFAILFVSCIGNVGGFISPQVNLSKDFWKPLPYLIFSSFSLLGSLAIFLLPKIEKKPITMSTLTVETDEVHL